MERSCRYVADLRDWRLTPSDDRDASVSPILHASLAFVAASEFSPGAPRSPGLPPSNDRRPAGGSLRLRPAGAAQARHLGRIQDDGALFTVESTLPAAQFDWLVALPRQPNCTVQVELSLGDSLPPADAQNGSTKDLVQARYWATTTCGGHEDGADFAQQDDSHRQSLPEASDWTDTEVVSSLRMGRDPLVGASAQSPMATLESAVDPETNNSQGEPATAVTPEIDVQIVGAVSLSPQRVPTAADDVPDEAPHFESTVTMPPVHSAGSMPPLLNPESDLVAAAAIAGAEPDTSKRLSSTGFDWRSAPTVPCRCCSDTRCRSGPFPRQRAG